MRHFRKGGPDVSRVAMRFGSPETYEQDLDDIRHALLLHGFCLNASSAMASHPPEYEDGHWTHNGTIWITPPIDDELEVWLRLRFNVYTVER